MAKITLEGKDISTNGELPAVGDTAPDFSLVKTDMSDVSLADFKGKRKVLDIAVSLDTGICADSARRFNEEADKFPNSVMLVITADLPFAQSRFCTEANTDKVITLSMMRNRNFAKDYGVLMTDGPLAGITARAVVVLSEDGKVLYTQLVPEIADEPDYDAALAAL